MILQKSKYSLFLSTVIFLYSLWLFTGCSKPDTPANKVIVVHARGLTYPDLIAYMSRHHDGFFQDMNGQGNVSKLAPITNAVTICNIASFETGAMPSEHGIVGHLYGIRGEDDVSTTSGFAKRYAVETFWEKADRNGKQVLNVGALTLHGKYETHERVDCLAQGAQRGATSILRLYKSSTDQTKYVNAHGQRRFVLKPGLSDSLYAYSIAQNNTLFLVLDDDEERENGFLGKLGKGEWLEIANNNPDSTKTAFRVKWVESGKDTIRLYARAFFVNRGYPQGFLREIDNNVGPSKGWPNIPLFATGKITMNTLVEEINYELDYVMDVFSYAAQRKAYDLIMVDYPLMDRLGHALLALKDSSKQVQTFYAEAFRRMNDDFEKIRAFAGQNDYELIITSGHGFSPIHTSINIENLLIEQGIDLHDNGSKRTIKGIPGKVSAHLYINDQLTAVEHSEIVKKLEEAFNNLEDPKSGERVVENIFQKQGLEEIGLAHPNAGDLFIQLKPGYVFHHGGADDQGIFGIPLFKGDHGYSLKHEDSYGIFIADVPCDPCTTTSVAKVIEGILN